MRSVYGIQKHHIYLLRVTTNTVDIQVHLIRHALKYGTTVVLPGQDKPANSLQALAVISSSV